MDRKFPVMAFLTPLSHHLLCEELYEQKQSHIFKKYAIVTSPTHIIKPDFIEIDNLAFPNRSHFSQGKRCFYRCI